MKHIETCETSQGTYPIYIGLNLVQQTAWLTSILPSKKVLIVTDDEVAKALLTTITQALSSVDLQVLILPSGEAHKNWESVSKILDCLMEHQFDRSSTLLSLGGGVVGDLSGFAAATYMRGMNWIQMPTTLLAQVDASVGGKTGFNYGEGKNLIGAFYQPKAVVCELSFLNNLPERPYLAGLAEVVKYGMICSSEFFSWLEANTEALKYREPEVLLKTVARSCEFKIQVVQADEKEQGQRMILNFGHTFAHAIESVTGFKTYYHGEAVSIGMLIATRLAVKLNYISDGVFDRLFALLDNLGLPTSFEETDVPIEALLLQMNKDKKQANGQLRLVLPSRLGKVKIVQWTDTNFLKKTLMEDYVRS